MRCICPSVKLSFLNIIDDGSQTQSYLKIKLPMPTHIHHINKRANQNEPDLPIRQCLSPSTLLRQLSEKLIDGMPHAHWRQFTVRIRHCADAT